MIYLLNARVVVHSQAKALFQYNSQSQDQSLMLGKTMEQPRQWSSGTLTC